MLILFIGIPLSIIAIHFINDLFFRHYYKTLSKDTVLVKTGRFGKWQDLRAHLLKHHPQLLDDLLRVNK